MKQFRKWICLALALVLTFALAAPVFAAGGSNGGSITIRNAVSGATYNAYRIFDLVKVGEAPNTAFSYTVAAGWEKFFEAPQEGEKYFEIDPTNGYVKWKLELDDKGNARTEDLNIARAYAESKPDLPVWTVKAAKGPLNKDGKTVKATIENLPEGYYLVTTNNGTLCALGTADPNVVVEEKNPAPVIKKQADVSNVTLGKNVHFAIPVVMGAANSGDYVISDTMTGLKLNEGSIRVQAYRAVGAINGKQVRTAIEQKNFTVDQNGDVTVTVGSQTYTLRDTTAFQPQVSPTATQMKQNTVDNPWTLTLTNEYLNQLQPDDLIVVTYCAEATGTTIRNEVSLEYGTAPVILTPTDHVDIATFDFKLLKYHMVKGTDGQDVEETLNGAEFQLYTQSKTDSSRQPISFVQTTTPEVTYTVATTEQIKTVSTITAGQVKIVGLAAGKYYLEEIKAPEGYNKLLNDVEITIDDTGKVTIKGNDAVTSNQVKIENKQGTELPSTGGIGTTIFYVVGGLLMTAAVVLLITKKRAAR